LWGGGSAPIRKTPICLLPRTELSTWLELTEPPAYELLSGAANDLLAALDRGGAMFPSDLKREARLLDSHFEAGLQELVARGAVTCDSYGALRQLIVPPSKRKLPVLTVGRWSRFRRGPAATEPAAIVPGSVPSAVPLRVAPPPPKPSESLVAFVAARLLARYGVLFRKLLAREQMPVTWRDLVRHCRTLELRGELRGGRFVAGLDGEQYALPDAVVMLRKMRREGGAETPADATTLSIESSAADPLNLAGLLVTPATEPKSTNAAAGG
jgi:ATP-dependent Lhr-like helicase